MPITLTCPSCRSDVQASDSERGTTIRCGICWAEVPVPGAPVAPAKPVTAAPAAPTPPKAPSIVRATPIPAAPVAPPPAASAGKVVGTVDLPGGLGRAVITERAPAAATPVAAAPAVAAPARPAAPVSRAEPAGKKPSRPRRRADDDDEAEDDRPREQPRFGLGKALVVLGLIGAVAAAMLAGGAYLAYRGFDRAPVAQEPTPTPQQPAANNPSPTAPNAPGPVANPPPFNPPPFNPPAAQRPTWHKDWNLLAGDTAVVARMPDRPSRRLRTVPVDGERLTGREYESEEGSVKYRVRWYDLPAELPLNAEELVRKLPQFGNQPVLAGPAPVRVGGLDGTELTVKGLGGETETVRAVKVGPRVFLFSVAYDPTWTRGNQGLDPEAKKREFFDSIRVTHDPNTPPPPSRSKRPKNPAAPPNPGQRGPDPAFPPGGTPLPGATGGLKLLARVEPFLAAAVLPERGEVLTFAPRGRPQRGGVVRRYAVTDFSKPLATVDVPSPVLLAAADERAGRLYVAAAATNDPLAGVDAANRLTALGEVQTFDLRKLLADPPPAGEVRPLARAQLGGKVTGLEPDPKGKTIYLSVAFAGRTKGKWQTKLWRYNAADLTPAGADIDLPEAVGALRLSPDGKHLAAAEFPYNALGYPQYGVPGPGHVHLIDAIGWRKTRTVQLPAAVLDLRFVSDGKAAAVVGGGPRDGKLLTLDTSGGWVDSTPPTGVRAAGYVVALPDGRLVLSGRNIASAGAEVITLGDGGPKQAAFGVVYPGGILSGPVAATPDGKAAVYGAGAAIDISAAGKSGAE